MSKFGSLVVGLLALVAMAGSAHATYWNVFNIEGESTLSAAIVTYATRADMLADTNRLGIFEPNTFGFGANVVDSGSDGKTYWNVFNIEGESKLSAAIVTYASLNDMLADTNRLGIFEPNTFGFGANVVGSGSDGKTYWNVFNIEGESKLSAAIVTYASLNDMLADTNRLGIFTPDTFGFGANVVGSGSDGSTYWNVFNIEGESTASAAIVTYGDLADMLADTNRLGIFLPDTFGFGANVVGSGSDSFPVIAPPPSVPEPGGLAIAGLALAGWLGRRRRV
jgi:hypothetical protein